MALLFFFFTPNNKHRLLSFAFTRDGEDAGGRILSLLSIRFLLLTPKNCKKGQSLTSINLLIQPYTKPKPLYAMETTLIYPCFRISFLLKARTNSMSWGKKKSVK